jgi:hypothetical protein
MHAIHGKEIEREEGLKKNERERKRKKKRKNSDG